MQNFQRVFGWCEKTVEHGGTHLWAVLAKWKE